MKRHVLVVGAGPAGLAAAEALLDRGGVDVTLRTLGHILGGKACSWKKPDGRTVEHGQHVVLGFYDEMRALIRRSGVDPDATSHGGDGRFTIWEDRDEQAHQLHLARSAPGALLDGLRYTGWTLGEKLSFASVLARSIPRTIAGIPESWDDLCFTAWCIERGISTSLLGTNAFRLTREAQLNWPGEISAYSMLKSIAVAGRDYQTANARVSAGGMSEVWWEPIADRIESLGGRIERYWKLTGIECAGGRLTGLRFARPLPHGGEQGHRPWSGSMPVQPGSERRFTDFDATIVTIPPSALHDVDGSNVIPHLGELKTVPPLAMHVWHKNPVTAKRFSVVAGMAPPLGFVVDNKMTYPEYRDDPRFGACLHFVGQEAGFEADDDETILVRALDSVQKIPGYEGIDRAGVLSYEVVRNRALHQQYWDSEPGSLQFKPRTRTDVAGLYLAGDWVRSELDFPCMENAVRTGRTAAKQVLRDLSRAVA